MKVKVNGIETEISDNATVFELAEQNNVAQTGTAIAVNDKLVRRADWTTTNLKHGDEIVIINAAYGG